MTSNAPSPLAIRRLGRASVAVTELGLGTAPLGELFDKIEEDEARRSSPPPGTAACAISIRRHGTGAGSPSIRSAARSTASRATNIVISTKIGRVLRRPLEAPTPSRINGSAASSSDGLRLQLRRRDALVRGQPAAARNQPGRRPPDPRPRPLGSQDRGDGQRLYHPAQDERMEGARGIARGRASSAGSAPASTRWARSRAILDLFDMDFFLSRCATRCSSRTCSTLEFPRCEERGVGIVIGGGYNSGILATGAIPARDVQLRARRRPRSWSG